MVQTAIQRSFAPIKKYMPGWIHRPIRRMATVFLGPFLFYYRKGYFRSAMKSAAVSRSGQPLPWYTYPAIDFLKCRDFRGKRVLEFGGGQSTLWWANVADSVVTMEGDKDWYDVIKEQIPDNVDLNHVSMKDRESNVRDVEAVLEDKAYSHYDVIVIDGLHRYQMAKIALRRVANDGIIVCDNAEGYGFYEVFKESGMNRVDFFGNAPGVVLPHSTSIYFKPSSFAFSPEHPIPVFSKDS